MKISTIMILAAGVGKRMGSYTNNFPKPLIKIKNDTVIEKIIKKVISNNFKKIIINLFYLKELDVTLIYIIELTVRTKKMMNKKFNIFK